MYLRNLSSSNLVPATPSGRERKGGEPNRFLVQAKDLQGGEGEGGKRERKERERRREGRKEGTSGMEGTKEKVRKEGRKEGRNSPLSTVNERHFYKQLQYASFLSCEITVNKYSVSLSSYFLLETFTIAKLAFY